MKKLLVFLLVFFGILQTEAQQKPVRIVFDVTSADPSVHESAIRHVSLMSATYPGSSYEVVIYGKGIDMVLGEKSSVSMEIQSLIEKSQVKFAVCELTMKKYQISPNQLIPGVVAVPDGILEIFNRQQEGWGYIKESN